MKLYMMVCACAAVFRLMSRWGFSYVENLTWVFLARNHSILQLPCANVQRSHITLYIFRKDGESAAAEGRAPLVFHTSTRRYYGSS
jgi:hypothetical protein